ncbi:MAG: redoxin domain-containing protein [Chryseotalea sp.]|jgi:peroxiredoxin|nr:redoxin domain-containing protein [Flammeovirgaceae bacterium]
MKNILSILFVLSCFTLQAQSIADFTLKNVMDGQTLSSSSYRAKKAIVVLFTSVACPFDGYYTNRIKALQQKYGEQITWLLVNAYTESPESEEWMLKAAQANGLNMPYLSDKDQQVMNALGAQRSPEVFLLKPTGNQWEVVYKGAIDDNAQAENGVRQAFLQNAMDSFLAGKTIATPVTRASGCYIRKK